MNVMYVRFRPFQPSDCEVNYTDILIWLQSFTLFSAACLVLNRKRHCSFEVLEFIKIN
jgi:hypothetical protein